MKKILFPLLTLLLGLSSKAQNVIQDSGEVSFELVKNTIIVPVVIDGDTSKFILDTGGIFSLSKELQSKGNFEVTDEIAISDIRGNESTFDKVRVPKIALGDLTFLDREGILIYDSEAYPDVCFGTQGMIGRDFFNGLILQFDYERMVIRLSNDVSSFDLMENTRQKLKISDRGLPEFPVKIDGKKKYIEFDSGSGDLFSYKTGEAEKIKSKVTGDKLGFKGVFSFGVSNREPVLTTRYKVWIDKMEIGGVTFENFYSDFSKPSAPRVGASLLYHGKVTIDYKNSGFYYEPYQNSTRLSPLQSYGFDIASIDNQYVIKWILENSKAEEAGLKYGLVVKRINGQSVDELAAGCDGYINGYSFHELDKITLEYIDSEGKQNSIELRNQVLQLK